MRFSVVILSQQFSLALERENRDHNIWSNISLSYFLMNKQYSQYPFLNLDQAKSHLTQLKQELQEEKMRQRRNHGNYGNHGNHVSSVSPVTVHSSSHSTNNSSPEQPGTPQSRCVTVSEYLTELYSVDNLINGVFDIRYNRDL